MIISDDGLARPRGAEHLHLVQFYGAEPRELVAQLEAYIREGLAAGSAILVVATPEHTDAILAALPVAADGRDPARAITFLDARTTLERFMVDGRPDWRRFEQTVGGIVRGLRRSAPGGTLRVYGEMVGLLWQAGETDAAVCLERFWNVLLGDDEFALFCGYPIDVFSDDLSAARDLLHAHTHVLYGAEDAARASALEAATRDVLGAGGAEVGERTSAVAADLAAKIFARARTYYDQCA